MSTKEVVLLIACIAFLVGGCASPSTAADSCPQVQSVKTIPLKEGSGHDAAYDRFVHDDACEPTLIRALGDLRKMKDPRQAPFDTRFVVSDAAVFIFLIRRNLEVQRVLPEEVASLLPTQGIYAYFDYVSVPSGREFVVARVKQLAKNPLNDPAR